MDGTGFLQLQGRFRGDGQRWSTRHYVKRLCARGEINRFGPINSCCRCQLAGQRFDCGKQVLAIKPMRPMPEVRPVQSAPDTQPGSLLGAAMDAVGGASSLRRFFALRQSPASVKVVVALSFKFLKRLDAPCLVG